MLLPDRPATHCDPTTRAGRRRGQICAMRALLRCQKIPKRRSVAEPLQTRRKKNTDSFCYTGVRKRASSPRTRRHLWLSPSDSPRRLFFPLHSNPTLHERTRNSNTDRSESETLVSHSLAGGYLIVTFFTHSLPTTEQKQRWPTPEQPQWQQGHSNSEASPVQLESVERLEASSPQIPGEKSPWFAPARSRRSTCSSDRQVPRHW